MPEKTDTNDTGGAGLVPRFVRPCVICGARVRNINPNTTTCDPACTMANDYGISRQRALRLIGDQPNFDRTNKHTENTK